MKKFSIGKKKIIIGYLVTSLISLIVLYISFLGSIDEVSANEQSSINSLQSVITQIHKEDSNLYKMLLSGNILSSEISNNLDENGGENSVISNLINLKSTELFTSQKLASTIDDYYSIGKVRLEIIELYKTDRSSDKIDELLLLYDKNVEIVLNDVESEMKFINEFRANCQKIILQRFIIFEIILVILFLLLYFKFSSESQNKSKSEDIRVSNEVKLSEISEDMILDSDCRKILEFIGTETSRGSFPTFKDLKSHLGLSHPTVLAKVNDLESRKLIGIRKQGRNKHLFLR